MNALLVNRVLEALSYSPLDLNGIAFVLKDQEYSLYVAKQIAWHLVEHNKARFNDNWLLELVKDS